MGKGKNQMLNMQAQLEFLGKRLAQFSKLKFNENKIQPLGIEYQNVLLDLDAQQNCNKYTWKGFPDYLPNWLIEVMLYYRASLAGFFSGGRLYVLPYAQSQGVNIYGLPNAVHAISYNGALPNGNEKVEFNLPISYNGTPAKNAQAVLLYDRIPVYSTNQPPVARAVLNRVLVEYQADILERIKHNLQNTNKKVVFYVDNEKQAEAMKQDLRDQYGSNDPFIVAVKNDTEEKNGEAWQNGVDSQTQNLFEAWQSINSIRCMCSGITNGGAFEKKERQITGEIQGDNVQTDLVIDAGLKMRRLWLEQMKSVYPEYKDVLDKITVEINEKSLSYEEKDTDKGGAEWEAQ